jgi:hypothetical protein
MATIDPGDPRQVELEDWLVSYGNVTTQIRHYTDQPLTSQSWPWRSVRIPHHPRTDDMRQMIEDIQNAK